MTFSDRDREDANESLNLAHEHLTDFVDIANEAEDEAAEAQAWDAIRAVEDLLEKYGKA